MTCRSLILCIALVSFTPAFAAEIAPTAPKSTTTAATRPAPKSRLASRDLRIQPRDFNFSSDDFYIAARQRALPKLLAGDGGGGGDELGNWLAAQSVNSADQFQIIVHLPATAPPVAAEIADDLVDFFRTYLTKEYEESRKRALERAQRDFDLNQRAADDVNQQLNQLRKQLRELSGRSDVAPKTLTAALTSMDDELQRLKIERLSKDARRSALEEQIAQLTERVAKRIESDPIATELQKVVDAREERIKVIKQLYEQGGASRDEVSQAVAQAAEAKAKVLQQQRDASATAGGSALEAFNRELMMLSIDAKELDTKSKYLEERLPPLRQAVELLDDYTRIEQRAKEANASLDITTRNLQAERTAQEQSSPPKVLLMESKNDQVE